MATFSFQVTLASSHCSFLNLWKKALSGNNKSIMLGCICEGVPAVPQSPSNNYRSHSQTAMQCKINTRKGLTVIFWGLPVPSQVRGTHENVSVPSRSDNSNTFSVGVTC